MHSKREVRDVLVASRKVISKQNNWIKGQRNNSLGGYCALGALDAVVGYRGTQGGNPTLWGLAQHKLNLAVPNHSIVAFNDRRSTTHKDILKAFDKAICELDQESEND